MILTDEVSRAKAEILVLAASLERPNEKNVAVSSLLDTKIFSAGVSGSVGIEEARAIKEFLFLTPLKSSRRLAIVEDGDALTPEAQNALLKIAEEPPNSALFLIIAKREENILPTLRSRLQRVHRAYGESQGRGKKQDDIRMLARQFFISNKKERSAIIKKVIGDDNKNPDLTESFLDAIVSELRGDIPKNSAFLKAVLERRRMMGELSLNKRLQLEFLSDLWYN